MTESGPEGYILLTGGAGFIGSHFREMFPNQNFVITDINAGRLESNNQYHIAADIRDKVAMRNVFEKFPIHTIIHLAAAHRDFGIEQDEYFSTNVGGAKVLCELAKEFGVLKIVFYSSVAIFGERNLPSDDETVPQPSNDYGWSKLNAEKVFEDWLKESNQRLLIIFRPTLVYGERNIANMYNLIHHVAKGMYFNVGKGANIKSIAYVKNLVEATGFVLQKYNSGEFIFNYSDEPHLTTAEIGNYIAAFLDKSKPKSISLNLLLLLAKPFDVLGKLSGKDLPISSKRVRKYATQTYHQSRRIFDQGFAPKYSSKEGLHRMVEWYKFTKQGNQKK